MPTDSFRVPPTQSCCVPTIWDYISTIGSIPVGSAKQTLELLRVFMGDFKDIGLKKEC